MATRRPEGMPPNSELWTDPDGGRWLVTVTAWAVVDGRVEPAGVELRSVRRTGFPQDEWARNVLPPSSSEDEDPRRNRTPPLPVTATTWKRVPVGGLVDRIRKREHEWRAMAVGEADPRLRRWRADKRRGPITQEAVAEVYLRARDRGDNPTQAVMTTFHLSKAAAANRVRRARKQELIPATTRGRATGGSMTDERESR